MEELIKKVKIWGDEKDITHPENIEKQFLKFIEEVFEFKEALTIYQTARKFEKLDVCNEKYFPNIEMEMGDILVTLIILSKQLDIDLENCLNIAYEKIKDRKGKTINGQFVKEEDLR